MLKQMEKGGIVNTRDLASAEVLVFPASRVALGTLKDSGDTQRVTAPHLPPGFARPLVAYLLFPEWECIY